MKIRMGFLFILRSIIRVIGYCFENKTQLHLLEIKRMKKYFFILSAFTTIILYSCQKDYTCVCTNSNTGNVSNGDTFKANIFTKKAAEESCKANNDVSAGSLENCHLE